MYALAAQLAMARRLGRHVDGPRRPGRLKSAMDKGSMRRRSVYVRVEVLSCVCSEVRRSVVC